MGVRKAEPFRTPDSTPTELSASLSPQMLTALKIKTAKPAERAYKIADGGGLAPTRSITVRAVAGERYERIIDYELGPLPEPIAAGRLDDEEDCPF